MEKDNAVIIYNCFSLYGEKSLLRLQNNTKWKEKRQNENW